MSSNVNVGTIEWANTLLNDFRVNGGTITNVVENADGLFEVTEDDGDKYTLNSSGAVVEEEETETTETTDTTGETVEEIQARIDELQEEKEVNESVMTQLKTEIEKLAKEAQEEIDAALAEKENIQDEQKQALSGIVSEELTNYQDSNGEMTREEFQNNVSSAISNSTDESVKALAGVAQNILSANQKLDLMDVHLGQMKGLIDENALIDTEIEGLEEQKLAAEAEEAATAASNCDCPDPIGFVNDEGVQYDFMIDADGDGKLTDASEFLGAENQFEAMQALDTDSDGKVSAEEMEAAGVKLVATDSSGSQSIVDVSEVFNSDDDYVDLESFNAQGEYAVEEGQTLNGTFDVVFDGEETYTGYSTNDTMDFLNANYEFSSGAAEGVAGATAAEGAEGEFAQFYEQYTELSKTLRLELEEAYAMIGLSEEIIDSVDSLFKADAEIEGGKIYENFISIAKAEKEAEEATDEAEETEAVDETEETEVVDEETPVEDEVTEETPAEDEVAVVADETSVETETPEEIARRKAEEETLLV